MITLVLDDDARMPVVVGQWDVVVGQWDRATRTCQYSDEELLWALAVMERDEERLARLVEWLEEVTGEV